MGYLICNITLGFTYSAKKLVIAWIFSGTKEYPLKPATFYFSNRFWEAG